MYWYCVKRWWTTWWDLRPNRWILPVLLYEKGRYACQLLRQHLLHVSCSPMTKGCHALMSVHPLRPLASAYGAVSWSRRLIILFRGCLQRTCTGSISRHFAFPPSGHPHILDSSPLQWIKVMVKHKEASLRTHSENAGKYICHLVAKSGKQHCRNTRGAGHFKLRPHMAVGYKGGRKNQPTRTDTKRTL